MYSYVTSRNESATVCNWPSGCGDKARPTMINLWPWYYTYIFIAECKLEAEKKEMKKKAEEYLARAEQLKKRVKDLEGIWL